MPTNLPEAMNLATMMSQSKLVPAALQKSPADCLLVIEQAMRWRMSVFAVAQEVSVIQGKMMFSGKIVAAAIHTSGVLEGRLSYEYSGQGAGLAVRVAGLLRGEAEPRDVDVTLASAKTNNQWWVKTPEQMLSYHGARVWARRHAPEVMLGVYAPEEMEELQERDIGPQQLEPHRRSAPQITRQALDESLQGDQIPDFDAPPPPPKPKATTPAQWVEGVCARFAAAADIEAFNEMQLEKGHAKAVEALRTNHLDLHAQYEEARGSALDRIAAAHEPQEPEYGEEAA